MRVRFWRWVGWFSLGGFAVPLLFCFYWRLGGKGAIAAAMYLWPASVEFIDLGAAAQPRATMYSVWVWSFIENAIIYASLGALLWLFLRVITNGYARLRAKPR